MGFKGWLFPSTSQSVVNGVTVGNKAISTEQKAKELYHIYGDGISLKPSNAFFVAPKTGLTCTVPKGFGIMSGYPFELDADLDITMNSSTSEQTIYIGVRLNITNGEYEGGNVAARTTFVPTTDRVFAIIVIPANAVTLTLAMITDTRYLTAYCGTINGQRVALEELANEYRDKIVAIETTGIPQHHTTHEPGGSDPIPFVAYSASQSLSDAQKLQARNNMSAAKLAGSYVDPEQACMPTKIITVDYTLTAADNGYRILVNSASQVTVTVNTQAAGLYAANYGVVIERAWTGDVVIAGASGVGFRAPGGRMKIAEVYSSIAILKDTDNMFSIVGSTKS
jgi:hypothetical protein